MAAEKYRDYVHCSAYSRVSDDQKRWNTDGTEAEPRKSYVVSSFSYCCEKMSVEWGKSIKLGDETGLDENINMAGVAISFCPFCASPITVKINRIPGY